MIRVTRSTCCSSASSTTPHCRSAPLVRARPSWGGAQSGWSVCTISCSYVHSATAPVLELRPADLRSELAYRALRVLDSCPLAGSGSLCKNFFTSQRGHAAIWEPLSHSSPQPSCDRFVRLHEGDRSVPRTCNRCGDQTFCERQARESSFYVQEAVGIRNHPFALFRHGHCHPTAMSEPIGT